MNVETRKTASGIEYWDTEEKRVRFVPAGQKPDFEVTKNPKSMLADSDPGKEEKDNQPDVDLNAMSVNELKSYAAELSIEIPADIKKKDDIIKFLSDGE